MALYNYVRMQQYGTMYGSQTWSCGLAVEHSQTTPISAADLSTWLTALDTALKAWWTSAGSLQNANTVGIKYTGARAYSYAAAFNTAFAQADHPFAVALLGSQGSNQLPIQTSLVTSMLSGNPGRSFRGRRYLPITAMSLTLNQVPSVTVDSINAAETALFNAINSTAIGSGTGKVTTANKKNTPSRVFTARTDSEPDIQRRRADKVVATYFKSTALA